MKVIVLLLSHRNDNAFFNVIIAYFIATVHKFKLLMKVLPRNSSCSNYNFLRLRIAATSIPEYVSGWCGHGFESHSQPFLLTYPGLIKASVFSFRLFKLPSHVKTFSST